MIAQRLKLGRYFGIELFVHWTFSLLVAYVAYTSYVEGGSTAMIAFSIAQLFAVFLCVTLHEYGHSLVARRYGVDTVDITLLPIGGVARLKRIPRIPVQEFFIAIAGPAVNVCIALIIVIGMSIFIDQATHQLLWDAIFATPTPETEAKINAFASEVFEQPSVLGFTVVVLFINIMLVLFNFIPAFPMDGGRVLRSILAMRLPYEKATRLAQRIGMVCAALLFTYAITSDPPKIVMVAISLFIVYAGATEAKQVSLSLRCEGLTVGDVMTCDAASVSMDMRFDELRRWWIDQSSPGVAVVGLHHVVVGVITIQQLAKAIEADKDQANTRITTAGELADHNAPVFRSHTPLEVALSAPSKYRQFAVVDDGYRLVGWLDVDTALARATLYPRSFTDRPAPSPPADFLFAI